MKNDNAVSKVSGQVHSYTSKVSEVSTVSDVSKMSKQGAQQSLHFLLPMGEGGRRPYEGADVVRSYTLETAKEVRSTIIHDDLRHEATEPASFKSLVPQCPSNLVPLFAPSVRKSASPLAP